MANSFGAMPLGRLAPVSHFSTVLSLVFRYRANTGWLTRLVSRKSRLVLARAALTAGLTGEARRHAEAARAAGLDQRRLWMLLAEIEGENEAGGQALRQALVAAPDPTWRCTACHAAQTTWQPACPACGTVGGLR